MFFWKPSRESGHWLFNCTSLTHTQQPPAFPPSSEKVVVPIPMTAMTCAQKQVLQSHLLPTHTVICKNVPHIKRTVSRTSEPWPATKCGGPGDCGPRRQRNGGKEPRAALHGSVKRATTIGDASNNSSEQRGRRQDSAIYFTGHNMTRNRVLNLTLKKDGSECQRVLQLRRESGHPEWKKTQWGCSWLKEKHQRQC